ncbi:19650_t:CDS:2, partial [Dentiscutata erythropus]
DKQFFETLIHLLLTTIQYNNNQLSKEFNQIIPEVKAKWIATNKFNYSSKNFEKSNQETDTESRLEILYLESLSTNPSINKLNKKFKKANKQIQQDISQAKTIIGQLKDNLEPTETPLKLTLILLIKEEIYLDAQEEQTNMYIPDDSHRMVEDHRVPADFTNM